MKYKKYGHHKKKKWRSCTLQFIIDFAAKHRKKNSYVEIYLAPGKYKFSENILITDGVGFGFRDTTTIQSELQVSEAQWPPKIIQKPMMENESL